MVCELTIPVSTTRSPGLRLLRRALTASSFVAEARKTVSVSGWKILGCAWMSHAHSCFFPVSLYSGRESTRQLASSVSSDKGISKPASVVCVYSFSLPFLPLIGKPCSWLTIEETRLVFKQVVKTAKSDETFTGKTAI